MDKQICFVLLSCMFVTVYLQTDEYYTLRELVRSKIRNFYKDEILYLVRVVIYESFTVMSQKGDPQNYVLVQVKARHQNDQGAICTAIVKHLNVTDIDCIVSEDRILFTQTLVHPGYLQKTINKAVDLINKKSTHRMVATSLEDIRLHLTANGLPNYWYNLIVAKTTCPNTLVNKESDNISCPILTCNLKLSEKYRVYGMIEHSPDDPIISMRNMGKVNPTS